ncbi:MAG: hypothetical protein HYX38_37380 [Rhodospirillales bacterium]|nr:hypothetical protein [Rhodospirillales bacterium]
MATFTVSNLNDSGAGSLRAAIEASNAGPPGEANTISFTVSGTIVLTSNLAAITNPTSIIAGSTDTGTPPSIGLDCNGNAGLVFDTGAQGSQLIGLAVGNAGGNGVTLVAGNITLNNNYIGLALDGSAAGNSGDGVFVAATSSANQIGYNPEAATLAANGDPATGVVSNVISGNGGNGISLHGSADNIIVSNRIGTSVDGNSAVANGANGIWVTDGSNDNTIGGTVIGNDASGNPNDPTGNKGTQPEVFVTPPLGNQISGNGQNGVLIDAGSQNNALYGNFVGTDAAGNTAVGNALDGVRIDNADFNSLHGCTVVDEPFVYYNVVSGNGANGIHVTDSDHVTIRANFAGVGADNQTIVANGNDGVLIDGSSRNTQVGGVIPLGNVISGNANNGIEVADTASGFSTLNTFGGTLAFAGIAPNGNNGVLITSTGGNQTVQTNVLSGNVNNGLEISGDAWGVTVVPNIFGLNTRGNSAFDFGDDFANGNNGILISGNAHDNVIGGTGVNASDSVIRQNTISNNGGYGIAVTDQAYNNVIGQSAIGTDIQEAAAIGNGAGGVLVSSTGIGNVVGTAYTGFSPLPAPAARYNVISGNDGPGVELDSGTHYNAVINNWIGLDVRGEGSLPNTGLPVDNAGTNNLIYGNAYSGPVPVESPTGQLELLYVGWYGRAGDPTGFANQMEELLTLILGGQPLASAILTISQDFATSPEEAAYAELASLVTPTVPTPQQLALAEAFVNETFLNLFDRAATTAEKLSWSTAFFGGLTSFSALVYEIATNATGNDIGAMNAKIQAASYFTQAFEAEARAPTVSEMRAAVDNVNDATTLYDSQAATNALVGESHNQVDYQTILSPLDGITGIRADYDGAVILTGSQGTSGSTATTPFLYRGPLNDTAAGTLHLLTPTFAGQTITSGQFYGPDTSIFTPSIGVGNVRAVGTYQYAESPPGVINHGMIYEGPIDGVGGTWTQIDVPGNGVNVVGGIVLGTVGETIPHSVQGDLVVGNYDISGVPGTGNGFIYNMVTGQYTLFEINGSLTDLTSVYGIWQHGVGGTEYTIAGGAKDTHGVNSAFLINYDSSNGQFSDLAFFNAFNRPGVITHFENISAVPGGFNLVATTDDGPAFVFVPMNPDGSFGEAIWTAGDLPGSNLMTGNIVYQNVFGGIYNTDDTTAIASYLGVVDQSYVNADGGLIMPTGSFYFSYALSVGASNGDIIVGSTTAGNVLGGSIGNDEITGTLNTTAADTIFTGGGRDLITLSAGGTGRSRVELFAANGLAIAADLSPGETVTAVKGSIVSAQDIPQLGWWGQATGQLGGPVSDASTNGGMGTGTSQDMSTVVNFTTGSSSSPIDMIDISLDAFSNLLRSADGNDAQIGAATFSNMVGLGGTITVADANVILITSNVGFANAADLAASLLANPITFASAQTEQFNHYIVAYQDFDGDVRIADMNIHANGMTSFTTTAGGSTLAISDMAELSGVSLASLQAGNVNFVSNNEIAHSSYLDFTGYGITNATTVVEAYGLNQANVQAATTATTGINVAIILDRVTDPTSLLSENWGTRQQTLAQLESAGTLWDTYGADQAQYNAVVAELQGTYGLTVLDGNTPNGNYVSSAESRTIWVAINTPEQFLDLFGQTLYYNNDGSNSFLFWNGNLSLPSQWNVQGLWFDTENNPPPSNMAPGVSVTLNQGAQGIGNTTASVPNMAPQDIAALYNFPLIGQDVATGTIALIEPGIGDAVLNTAEHGTFDQRLASYLQSIGQSGTGTVYVQGRNGQDYLLSDPDERSQDVGTVAAVNPNSNIGLYVGSGYNGNADASTFTALQSAIWDTTNNPGVISNSFGDDQSMSPDSPFYQAYWQLYIDAALRNQTLFSALGDGGSGNETGNGLTNVEINITSPYSVLVGGTSLSTLGTAESDPTLSSIVASALADDRSTIWQLMAGGLTSLPDDANALQVFVETVWNTYQVTGATIGTSDDFWGGYLQNTTTSGGVDPTQPAPWYQTAYGLNPVTSDPLAQAGRGVPDVSANAGGNLQYLVPNGDLTENTGQIGTSSAAPFWAALTVQFNAIFADQDLPQLGYMNDLLYIASAIAPAAFNDVTLGGNMSSFSMGGSYNTLASDGTYVNVTPTGYGYYAGPGYDLVSGLGSPNGLLLARALTSIAHSQVSFSTSPDMLDADGSGWTSGADQSLLFQTMSGSSANVSLDLGSDILSFTSVASGSYAWTNRVAQQSMQADFDPNLVRMFDKYGQGAVAQSMVSQGESIGVSINASAADAIQGALSSPFGFADFVTDSGVVRVARPVAVAETVGAQDDQTAIVRLRQNGEDSLSVSFYRVDDLSGSIDGIQVGQAGYAQAAQGRAYQVSGGGTSIGGPGYGNFGQSALLDVDAGDLIAMKLVNQTTNDTYWAFAQGNEVVSGQSVGHLWNYGLNTWGWEDMRNGGDRDFNDLIVQFDFTSAYGNHWLV